jgi:hypothetical protein
MDWASYGINILIAASSWFIGIMIARLVLRRFFSIGPDGPEMMGGGVTTDDVLDFDKSEMPYIPVKVSKENGLYYAWFKGNDKFIGQSEREEDIELMAYRHMMKMVGLRMEFKHEEEPLPAKTEGP